MVLFVIRFALLLARLADKSSVPSSVLFHKPAWVANRRDEGGIYGALPGQFVFQREGRNVAGGTNGRIH